MLFEAHGKSFPCTELVLFNYAKVNTVFHSMAPLNPFLFHLQVMQQQRSTKRSASTHPTPMSKEDLSGIKDPESKHRERSEWNEMNYRILTRTNHFLMFPLSSSLTVFKISHYLPLNTRPMLVKSFFIQFYSYFYHGFFFFGVCLSFGSVCIQTICFEMNFNWSYSTGIFFSAYIQQH